MKIDSIILNVMMGIHIGCPLAITKRLMITHAACQARKWIFNQGWALQTPSFEPTAVANCCGQYEKACKARQKSLPAPVWNRRGPRSCGLQPPAGINNPFADLQTSAGMFMDF